MLDRLRFLRPYLTHPVILLVAGLILLQVIFTRSFLRADVLPSDFRRLSGTYYLRVVGTNTNTGATYQADYQLNSVDNGSYSVSTITPLDGALQPGAGGLYGYANIFAIADTDGNVDSEYLNLDPDGIHYTGGGVWPLPLFQLDQIQLSATRNFSIGQNPIATGCFDGWFIECPGPTGNLSLFHIVNGCTVAADTIHVAGDYATMSAVLNAHNPLYLNSTVRQLCPVVTVMLSGMSLAGVPANYTEVNQVGCICNGGPPPPPPCYGDCQFQYSLTPQGRQWLKIGGGCNPASATCACVAPTRTDMPDGSILIVPCGNPNSNPNNCTPTIDPDPTCTATGYTLNFVTDTWSQTSGAWTRSGTCPAPSSLPGMPSAGSCEGDVKKTCCVPCSPTIASNPTCSVNGQNPGFISYTWFMSNSGQGSWTQAGSCNSGFKAGASPGPGVCPGDVQKVCCVADNTNNTPPKCGDVQCQWSSTSDGNGWLLLKDCKGKDVAGSGTCSFQRDPPKPDGSDGNWVKQSCNCNPGEQDANTPASTEYTGQRVLTLPCLGGSASSGVTDASCGCLAPDSKPKSNSDTAQTKCANQNKCGCDDLIASKYKAVMNTLLGFFPSFYAYDWNPDKANTFGTRFTIKWSLGTGWSNVNSANKQLYWNDIDIPFELDPAQWGDFDYEGTTYFADFGALVVKVLVVIRWSLILVMVRYVVNAVRSDLKSW